MRGQNINAYLFNILFLSTVLIQAQNKQRIDSLLKQAEDAKSDTLKCLFIAAVSQQLAAFYPDSAKKYAGEAFEIARQNNYKIGKAKALYCFGAIAQAEDKDTEAMNYYLQALDIFKELGSISDIAAIYTGIGLIYFYKNQYAEALQNFYPAIKKYKEAKDLRGEAAATGNVGLIYYNQGNYEQAIEFMQAALDLDKKANNEVGIARHNGNIGNAYFRKGSLYKREGKQKEADKMYAKAMEAFNTAFNISEKQDNKTAMAMNIGNIANLMYDLGDTLKTMEYYMKAYKIYESMGNKNGMSRQMGNMGWIYLEMKDYKNAEKCTKDAIALVEDSPDLELSYNWHDNLSTIYEMSRDFESAYLTYKKTILIRDSLYNVDKAKRALETQMKFEFEKKEAVAKEEQARQVIIRNAFIGGFVLMFVMAIIVFRGYRNKQKANQAISEQKELLQEKNKEIMDSIRYAKRIQKAHMPNDEYIARKIKELKKPV